MKINFEKGCFILFHRWKITQKYISATLPSFMNNDGNNTWIITIEETCLKCGSIRKNTLTVYAPEQVGVKYIEERFCQLSKSALSKKTNGKDVDDKWLDEARKHDA